MSDPTRRALLTASAALVACGGAKDTDTADSGGVPATRTPEPSTPWPGRGTDDGAAFPMGVQAGAPRPEGLTLWTKYVGAETLSVVVAAWDGTAWTEVTTLDASPADGGYTHVILQGQLPDMPLAYQFEDSAGARSPVGHARTATSARSTAPVRIGACSCLHQEHVEFPALHRVQEVGPVDLFFWLGDTVYQDGNRTLEAYRDRWATNLGSQTFRTLLSGSACVYTWDDHEVTNNWDARTIDPDHLAAATAAFFEIIPHVPEVRERLWHSFRYGPVEFWVLDCRGERDVARTEGDYGGVERHKS